MPSSLFELINLQYGDIKKDEVEVWKKDKRQLILFKNIDYKNNLDSIFSLIVNITPIHVAGLGYCEPIYPCSARC